MSPLRHPRGFRRSGPASQKLTHGCPWLPSLAPLAGPGASSAGWLSSADNGPLWPPGAGAVPGWPLISGFGRLESLRPDSVTGGQAACRGAGPLPRTLSQRSEGLQEEPSAPLLTVRSAPFPTCVTSCRTSWSHGHQGGPGNPDIWSPVMGCPGLLRPQALAHPTNPSWLAEPLFRPRQAPPSPVSQLLCVLSSLCLAPRHRPPVWVVMCHLF